MMRNLRMLFGTSKQEWRQLLWVGSGEGGSRALALCMSVYLTRVLGADGFGLWTWVLSFLSYLHLASDFGTEIVSIRMVSRDRQPGIVSRLVSIRFVWALLLLLLAESILFLLPSLNHPLRNLFAVSFLWILAMAVNTEWAFLATDRIEISTILKILKSAIILIMVIVFVRTPDDLIRVPFARFSVPFVISWVVVIYWMEPKIKLWNTQIVSALIKGTGLLGITFILAQVYHQADKMIIGFLLPREDLGQYGVASHYVAVSLVAAVILVRAYFPSLSRARDPVSANHRRY